MDSRTQERVEQWDSRPFGGGYDELATLSENGFSGAVTAAGTWLFMLNGRVVGVVDGEIEDFEHAAGTVYTAPDPAVPLLASMRERGGDRRAQYYTNETPLAEVDETLQSGSFTGYVELSEQVLSGDYYLVYYGGRRMAVAYIGNAGRLLTGDEAFDRAADEVGIYEVFDVDVEVTDVPTPGGSADGDVSDPTTDAADASGSGAESAANATDEPDSTETPAEPDSAERTAESGPDTGRTAPESASVPSDEESVSAADDEEPISSVDDAESVSAADDTPRPASAADRGEATDEPESTADDAPSPASDDEGATTGDGPTPDRSGATTGASGTGTATEDGSTTGSNPDAESVEEGAPDDRGIDWSADRESTGDERSDADGDGSDSAGEDPVAGPDDDGSDAEDDVDERLEREERWRETRSIPSIDPAKTSTDASRSRQERSNARSRRSSTASAAVETGARTVGPAAENASTGSGGPSGRRTEGDADGSTANARDDRVRELRERLEEATEARDRLESKAAELESERDELRAKNEELADRIEGLQAKVERLEAELERERARSLDAGSNEADGGGKQVPPERALSGTNLFVRYDTKSDATLEMAHEGDAERDAVTANLRLEHHTDFDDEEATVTGQSYEEFLTSTMEYRFVDWLTETLLFEIRDTGHADDMGDLYDVIPRIDRAELDATISLEDTEDGPDRVAFDVVAFDKMGTPLIAVTLNESREPAGEDTLSEVEEAASAVKANYPDFGAAMVVTSSFFDPGALEVTEEATAGGFLSRGSKQSYVTISRKNGYHLCLVECRSGGFHVTVPEL